MLAALEDVKSPSAKGEWYLELVSGATDVFTGKRKENLL